MAIEDFDQVTIAAAHIRPFSKFIMSIGEMPTSYLDSLSYAEQVTWFCNFLQDKVIPAINNNAEALEEVQNLMTQLQEYVDNYFTNLDVQEEINNKLDDMVEQGTLQEIIAEYLNSKAVFGYDTVSDMKSATNLINGSYAKTLGYYSKNDGGMATYKIRTITNDDVVDEMFIIELNDNNLIAELIIEDNTVNIKQVGAKENDNTFDNSTILQKVNDKELTIFVPEGNYYLSNSLKLNIEKGSIYGISSKSSLLKNSTFNDTELILVYSNNGDYYSRNNRVKKIHDLSLIGINETNNHIAIKIGGDNSTSYEGHVDCVEYENINIKNFNEGLHLNSHLYKNNFINVIIDQVNYYIKSDENQSDMNEATNFIGCAFWSGSLYTQMNANFIGCTHHINHQEIIKTITTNIYIYNCIVNFTDCHFESLNTTSVPLTTALENIIIADRSTVTIDNPYMLVSGNKITINDSVFKTINPAQATVGNVASILLKNGTCKYLFGRITAGSNFVLCKGNVTLYTNTVYKNDSNSQLEYKIYDYSNNNVLTQSSVNELKLENALSNATLTITNNNYNFTKSSEASNSFGFYKIFRTNGHKAMNFIINATSDVSAVKIQKRYSNMTLSNSCIVFLDKDGNVIPTTLQPEQYSDGQTMNTNAYLNIPDNCEFIKFGIVGYGFQYQTNVTFTITQCVLELV